LQLVNILRDLPRDLKMRRCYLPLEILADYALTPEKLLDPRNEHTVRPMYNRYLDRAEELLGTGWEYTCELPAKPARVKLACAWPLLIGQKTIDQLKRSSFLDPRVKVQVSRQEVYSILSRTVVFYPFPKRWERLFVKRQQAR
jgi:farnesyl-diphosphate farnesyltransferase